MDARAKSAWLTWPNAITLLRVGLGALCLAPLTSGAPQLLRLAFGLMLVAELSDFLDGFVARATGSVSEIGKVLDPMADSMYRLMIFAAFVQAGWMAAWMLSIFIVRDVGVAYARVIASRRGAAVGARASGKLKAIVQGVAQLFAVGVAAFELDALAPFSVPLLYLAAAVTLYSLADYAFGLLRAAPD